MAFFVGQEVCCRDDNGIIAGDCVVPKKGGVYSIVEITGRPGLCLAETDNPRTGWHPSRFRPVRTTSISIFTSMLRKAPAKEPA